MKQKVQPRNSCPVRNPWPCFQWLVYHATLVSHPSLPRHHTQHSHCSPSLKSLYPLFISFILLILLSRSRPSLMFVCLGLVMAPTVWSDPWVKKHEGDQRHSVRTHSGNAVTQYKHKQRNLENCPNTHSHSFSVCASFTSVINGCPWWHRVTGPILPSPITLWLSVPFMSLFSQQTLYECIILSSSLWRLYLLWSLGVE